MIWRIQVLEIFLHIQYCYRIGQGLPGYSELSIMES